MEKSKGLSIVLLIPTVVIGVALVKAFDFENLRFEKPALALVYFVGLALSIAFQWNALRKTRKE